MFIFYFAVASAITPPVALAAFAASSITNADPMRTGFSAVKSGIVMFTIPFIFALYPELLLIKQAVIDPATGTFFAGYDGQIDLVWLGALVARLALALYLVSSAMAAFDQRALGAAVVSPRGRAVAPESASACNCQQRHHHGQSRDQPPRHHG